MTTDTKDGLADFSSVERNLKFLNRVDRGVRPIPLDSIVGSLRKYQDFTREFLPHRTKTSPKYRSVRDFMLSGATVPPIRVYKVLEQYFVVDGHHRVTVAKNVLKAVDIDAEVVEVVFDVDLSPDKEYSYSTDRTREVLIALQADAFQRKTLLRNAILVHPLIVTELGSLAKLYDEISSFRSYYENGALTGKDYIYASHEWYEKRFLPAVKIILAEELLTGFENRTYTDLYVWIQQHKYYLSQIAGHDVGFDQTKDDFVKKYRKIKFLDLIPRVTRDIVTMIKKKLSGKLDIGLPPSPPGIG